MQRQTQTKDRDRSQADTQTETAAQSHVDRHNDRNASDTGIEGDKISRYAGAHGDRHRDPHTADLVRLVNTAVQSEADTRLAVTHSGPGPALSLLGGGRGGANSGGKLGKGIPSGRPARVAESQQSPSRQSSPPPPPSPR